MPKIFVFITKIKKSLVSLARQWLDLRSTYLSIGTRVSSQNNIMCLCLIPECMKFTP